jgi:hypothetical protein
MAVVRTISSSFVKDGLNVYDTAGSVLGEVTTFSKRPPCGLTVICGSLQPPFAIRLVADCNRLMLASAAHFVALEKQVRPNYATAPGKRGLNP